jgi:hypothetical protein
MHIDHVVNASPPQHGQIASQPPLPSPLRIGLSRVVPELKMFYRRPEQLALTFSMPAVICILLGSIFSTKLPRTETSTGAVIAASMLAYGILSTSFINLGISIAADPNDRILVFHRENLARCHSQSRRGHRSPVGRAALLRTAATYNGFRMVHADVGVYSRDRQLFAVRHLHQQFSK